MNVTVVAVAVPSCGALLGGQGQAVHSLDWNGVCVVVAAGRANHAGTAVASGPMPAGSGNEPYVGIEIEYAAEDPSGNFLQGPSDAQRTNSVVAAVAIGKQLGNDASYCRAHKETSTTGKIDPKYLMPTDELRDAVGQAIENLPG